MFPINLIGKDATEAFEDVGHSDEARGLLEGMFVGEFEKDGVSDPIFFTVYSSILGFSSATCYC